MSDPFAEKPLPWWRRFARSKRRTYAPRALTLAVGFVAGFVGLSLPSHHSLATALLAVVVIAAPAGLLESWYKRQHRRQEEQLFVLPEPQRTTTKIEPRR